MNVALSFPVPENGVELQPRRKQQDPITPKSEKPPQVIFLDVGQPTIHDLVKSCRNNERVSLRFGRKQILYCGEKSRRVYARPEVHPSELYMTGDGGLENLYFSGSFSHRIELERPQENASDGGEALAELTQSLNALKEEATSKEARIVTSREELKTLPGASKRRPNPHLSPLLGQPAPLRRDGLLANTSQSTNSSPFLGATNPPGATPNLGPTSAPLSKAGTSTKEQIRFGAIKIALTHLLALGPQSLRSVVQTIRAPQDDCQKVLSRFAQEVDGGQGRYKLKDKAYKDLDIWKFPYPTTENRQQALDRAISAFDRMRLARTDQLWQLLLPQQERGKGKCLSRLNFDGRQQNVLSRPVGGQKTGSVSKTDRKVDAEKDGSSNAAIKGAATTRPAQKKGMPVKEGPGAKRSNKDNTMGKASRAGKKAGKAQSKYKSSEIVEDSDEDIDASDSLLSEVTRPKQQQRQLGSTERKVAEKNHPTTQPRESSSVTQSMNNDRSRFLSGLNGRSRAASSPQKPSPLASSPPTNATDIENSSKASPGSSVASTPPSTVSSSRPLAHQQLAKTKTSSTDSSQSTNLYTSSSRPLKRTAEAASTFNNTAPPKRHQPNGISTNTTTFSKSNPQTNGHRPSSTLSSSASTSTTEPPSPTTPHTIESLFELSKRFGMAYKKYETLHAKLEKEEKPDAREMERLLRMHQRVAEMKEEMSRGWGDLSMEGRKKGGGR